MTDYHQALLPDHIYHVFSRANGNEKLFRNDDNYIFFLSKLKQHTLPVCDYFCYSLLPNHFHLLIKVKSPEEIITYFQKTKKKNFDELEHNLSDFIMERFSNCLNSYTKSFNKVYQRKGALFMDYLKRNLVEKEDEFTSFIWYIHKNAVHHHLTKSIGHWKFDSYQSYLSKSNSILCREEVLNWFGGKEAYIQFHNQNIITKINVYDL